MTLTYLISIYLRRLNIIRELILFTGLGCFLRLITYTKMHVCYKEGMVSY